MSPKIYSLAGLCLKEIVKFNLMSKIDGKRAQHIKWVNHSGSLESLPQERNSKKLYRGIMETGTRTCISFAIWMAWLGVRRQRKSYWSRYDPEGMVKGCLYLLNQTKPQYVLSILHMIATTIPFI